MPPPSAAAESTAEPATVSRHPARRSYARPFCRQDQEVDTLVTRVLIIVQNLPVPFDRRVWLECQALVSDGHQVAVVYPKGHRDPAHEVINTVAIAPSAST